MENSTGSAKRTAVTHPAGARLPSALRAPPRRLSAPACAFGGAPLRGSPGFAGSPSGRMAGLRPERFTKARPRPRGGRSTAAPTKKRRRKLKRRKAFQKNGATDVPQDGHQSAQEGRRGVFQPCGPPTYCPASRTHLRPFRWPSRHTGALILSCDTLKLSWNQKKAKPFQWAGLTRRPPPADGRRAGERRLQRPPPIPPPFPPAGRERVALCRQGCSRRGASLPCLPP